MKNTACGGKILAVSMAGELQAMPMLFSPAHPTVLAPDYIFPALHNATPPKAPTLLLMPTQGGGEELKGQQKNGTELGCVTARTSVAAASAVAEGTCRWIHNKQFFFRKSPLCEWRRSRWSAKAALKKLSLL